jgi:hypothetical protein
VIAALELDRRITRAGHAVAYLVGTLPVALLAIPAVAALVLGAALSVAGIGLPLLLAAAAACRRLVRFDRRAANRWLDAQVPPIPGRVRGPGSSFRQSLDLLSDRGLWRIAMHLALRPPLGAALLAVALLPVFALALLLQLGIEGIAGVEEVDYVGPWALGPALALVLCALALPAAALAIASLEALYRVVCVITRAFLAQSRAGRYGRSWPRASAIGPCRSPTGCRTAGASSMSSAGRSCCPSRVVGAPGPPSSATAGGSPRSSTTRRWTRAASSWRPQPRPLRWRSTTSG